MLPKTVTQILVLSFSTTSELRMYTAKRIVAKDSDADLGVGFQHDVGVEDVHSE